MANETGYCNSVTSYQNILERLEERLKDNKTEQLKLEAAIRCLHSNPDLQALLQLVR